MNRSIILSSVFHLFIIILTAISLPFLSKKAIDLPPIVSVELIQITEKTNIPFAPKAKKIIEKVKEKEKKLVSEQAPPKKVKKKKPDSVPMPEENVKKVEKVKDDTQNPEKVDNEVKQVSEFEKEELFDNGLKYMLFSHNKKMGSAKGAVLLAEMLYKKGKI